VTIRDLVEAIREDFRCNAFLKGKFIVCFYRLANYFTTGSKVKLIIGAPVIVLYIFITEWLMGVEIHVKTQIGKGFVVYHGVGLVINGYSKIGDFVTVRQGCCLGNKILADGSLSRCPVIGDHVEFGANSIAIGEINIGDHVVIGAGSVVIKDCESGVSYAGVPAKEIRK